MFFYRVFFDNVMEFSHFYSWQFDVHDGYMCKLLFSKYCLQSYGFQPSKWSNSSPWDKFYTIVIKHHRWCLGLCRLMIGHSFRRLVTHFQTILWLWTDENICFDKLCVWTCWLFAQSTFIRSVWRRLFQSYSLRLVLWTFNTQGPLMVNCDFQRFAICFGCRRNSAQGGNCWVCDLNSFRFCFCF